MEWEGQQVNGRAASGVGGAVDGVGGTAGEWEG